MKPTILSPETEQFLSGHRLVYIPTEYSSGILLGDLLNLNPLVAGQYFVMNSEDITFMAMKSPCVRVVSVGVTEILVDKCRASFSRFDTRQ